MFPSGVQASAQNSEVNGYELDSQRSLIKAQTAETYEEDWRIGETTLTQQQQHLSDLPSLAQANSYPSGQLNVTFFFMVNPSRFQGEHNIRVLYFLFHMITLLSDREQTWEKNKFVRTNQRDKDGQIHWPLGNQSGEAGFLFSSNWVSYHKCVVGMLIINSHLACLTAF